jgi:hypothetical protein
VCIGARTGGINVLSNNYGAFTDDWDTDGIVTGRLKGTTTLSNTKHIWTDLYVKPVFRREKHARKFVYF